MKNYIRQLILFSIGFILIIGIYIVDIVFYKVPSFIRVFRLEREIAAVVAIFLTFPLLKKIYFQKIQNKEKYYVSLFAGSLILLIILLLPHLFFKKYIALWENNPMLAEFPTIWTIYSVFDAVVFVILLLLFIQIIKSLVVKAENISIKLTYNLAIISVFVGACLLNVLEDRYLYQPVLDGYIGLFNEYKIAIFSFIAISSAVAIRGDWINQLNKKSKIICLIGGIFSLLILLYIFASQYIVAVYAFSTTLKGFVLLGYLFVAVFFVVSTIKLLFHLPTAARIDRTSQELQFITEIENMIKSNEPLNILLEKIVNQSMTITESNASWFEMIDIDEKYKITHSVNVEDNLIGTIGSFTVDRMKNDLVEKQQYVMINNIKDHPMTQNFKYLEIPWKSLLAVPIIQDNTVVSVLYVVKNKTNGYSKDDESTLSRFLAHLEKLFSPEKVEKYSQTEINEIHFQHSDYLFDIIGSSQLLYDAICEENFCCIFGISNDFGEEKIAELRGSLKILLQLNSPIDMIEKSIENFMDDNGHDFVFLFFDLESKELNGIKSSDLCYALCDESVTLSDKKRFSTILHDWGVFCFGKDTEIDTSQLSRHYKETGCIRDISDKFHLYFGEDLERENIVLIQVNSNN